MVKNYFKKIIAVFVCVCAFASLVSCTYENNTNIKDTDKLNIVTTLFAHYDFARIIAKDKADVSLLLPPGVESHTYEPSPADIIKIKNSDLFIYTGEHMESWASGIIDNLDKQKTTVLNVSENIELSHTGDEHHDNHSHRVDPHIWTSPANAIIMVQNICDTLCEIDSSNSQTYIDNANAYINELTQLDNEFTEMISQSKHKKIMFGGRFAMHYFTRHYGLEHKSAYDSCSSEAEPSARLVADIIDEMKENGICTIYYEEMSNHNVADQIAQEIDGTALLLHSCHNVSHEEISSGASYLSLMRQNLINLKKGLN